MWSEDLKEAGYDLAYCGKWHVSALDDQTPENYGWKELSPYSGSIQDAGVKWEKIRENATKPLPKDGDGWVNPPGYNSHKLYNEQEVAFKGDDKATELALEEIPKLAESGNPWVLFVGWTSPHTPYNAEKKYLDMYDPEDTELPPSFEDTMEDKPDYYRKLRQRVFDRNDIHGVKEAIRYFRACCTKIDDKFGLLMDKLEETGQSEDTLVVFCADHGDYIGDHGLFHKQVPAFLGAYMVPAVVKWPNGIKNPGRVVDDFVSLADFGPTFMEMAGAETDRYFSGDSLMPFLKDEKPKDWREEMCTQCEGTEQMFTQRMVATHEYKYVYNGFGRDEYTRSIVIPYLIIFFTYRITYESKRAEGYSEREYVGSETIILLDQEMGK